LVITGILGSLLVVNVAARPDVKDGDCLRCFGEDHAETADAQTASVDARQFLDVVDLRGGIGQRLATTDRETPKQESLARSVYSLIVSLPIEAAGLAKSA
jgi:hypothetical protein